jgi:hypothetical protein
VAAWPENVQRFAVAKENRSLILADNELGTEPKLTRTRFGNAANYLVRSFVWELNEIQDRHRSQSFTSEARLGFAV